MSSLSADSELDSSMWRRTRRCLGYVRNQASGDNGAGRVARLFSFALTDPGVRLSRTRLFPRVTVIGSHLRPCENDPRTGKGKAPFQSQEPIPSFASAFLAPSPKAIEPDAPNLVKE